MVRLVTRYAWLTIPLFLTLLITGCTGNSGSYSPFITTEGAYPVEAIFREFYDHLGGENILGPAISPMFVYANHKYQYLQTGCLEYNPDALPNQQFRLSPLGLDMGVTDPAVSAPDQPNQVYIAGHVIYSGFTPLYRKLGGARFVGEPLTEVHYNPEKKRFEQYFENLGFYWVENEPPEAVHLLAYGAWKCDSHCRHVSPLSAMVDVPGQTNKPTDKLFKKFVKDLGSDFTGYEISAPYLAADGKYEQIFENLVLMADPKTPDIISLRAVPQKLGILPEPPVFANNFQGMVFWPVDGERGHNVPKEFVDYINSHGGTEISGPPISELFLVGDDIFRQCFTTICLDYHLRSDVPQSLRIKTSPLGRAYKEMYYRPQTGNFIQSQSLKATSMQVWERNSFISSSQYQEIGASIFDGNTPVANIEPVVTLRLPEGAEMTYYFPPTGEDGKTLVRLDPIQAANGTIVEYKVCVKSVTNEQFCVKDSFVIWFNP